MKKHNYKIIKASKSWEILNLEYLQDIADNYSLIPRQIKRKSTQTVKVPGIMMDYFLAPQTHTEKVKKSRRQVLL